VSSTFARRSRKAGGLAALAVIAACALVDNQNYSVWFVNSPGGAYDFVVYTVGDTLRLAANELYETMNDKRETSSAQEPGLFTWSTSAPAKVELSSPGVFVMKEVGNATIGVRTSHATYGLAISILPEGAAFRLAPRDPVVTVGDKLTIVPGITDAQGSPAGVTLRASDVRFDLRGNTVNEYPQTKPPILSQDLNAFSFAVQRAGTVGMVATVPLYKRTSLRDSVLVTAK
jgi:hypothetical protein